MTRPDRGTENEVGLGFGFDGAESDRKADALRRMSERLINDSRELRKRSAELCDKIMRSQSV